MDVSFEINATQDNFEGALLFKLQRYSDSQYNVNTPITETNETTCIQMLIAWKVEGTKSFAHIILIEHAREFTWNEYKFLFIYLFIKADGHTLQHRGNSAIPSHTRVHC
jgi:hypothetical protein